jgi:Repeat of unknown function (DUF5650)
MRNDLRAGRARWCSCLALIASSALVDAAQVDIHGPAGSVAFGRFVAALPNGNFVVCDPSGPISNIGAVYLYGSDGQLISTLTGSTQDDQVCNQDITVLGNNFVVSSKYWNNASAVRAGAVTWINGTTGLNGIVSTSNSLVGMNEDAVYLVYVLSNGNYVVADVYWNGNHGAVTWASGSGGTVGIISASNSIVGSTAGDLVGNIVTPLSDGNYVIGTPSFSIDTNHSVGAATWLSGSGVSTGVVSASNSLVGTNAGDGVGNVITALQGGHYVVGSLGWSNAGVAVGAATWRAGGGAFSDTVMMSNSLFGTSKNDQIGARFGVLSNGDYVESGSSWNGNAGAATWGSGTSGIVGPVLPANSLTGNAGDHVGFPMTPLKNGNVVIGAITWSNGSVEVGASTLRHGNAAITGSISAANALVGTSSGDEVGFKAIALSDSNYVVVSPLWDQGRGAATWGNGTTGVAGPVLPANSLIGSTTGESLSDAVATDNGSYVVTNGGWNGGRGAVTWSRAGGTTLGAMAEQDSLVGTSLGDHVGQSIVALADGNYLVLSPTYHLGSAVTFGSGHFRLKGSVQSWNSVIGSGTTALPHGYDSVRHRLIVGRPSENMVSLLTMDQIFADDLDP